jgi:hypothetical protein
MLVFVLVVLVVAVSVLAFRPDRHAGIGLAAAP